jgi:hypothetical protein
MHLQAYLPIQMGAMAFNLTHSLVDCFGTIGTPESKVDKAMDTLC